MPNEEFFIPKPAFAYSETKDHPTGKSSTIRFYRTEAGEELKFSAEFPLPDVGQHIRITMNNIGEAEVVGFFKSGAWVGVMTKALDPPKYLKDQRAKERKSANFDSFPAWRKDGIGCEFGAEIVLL
jgi:hypothetical protein